MSMLDEEDYIDLALGFRKYTRKHPLKGPELVVRLREARKTLEILEIYAHLRKAVIE